MPSCNFDDSYEIKISQLRCKLKLGVWEQVEIEKLSQNWHWHTKSFWEKKR